jgi:hypothetical protein
VHVHNETGDDYRTTAAAVQAANPQATAVLRETMMDYFAVNHVLYTIYMVLYRALVAKKVE